MSDHPASEAARVNEIEERLKKSEATIDALCNGARWTMSVPAQPKHDPDLILTRSLGDLRDLLSTVSTQAAEISRLTDALEAANDREPNLIAAGETWAKTTAFWPPEWVHSQDHVAKLIEDIAFAALSPTEDADV